MVAGCSRGCGKISRSLSMPSLDGEGAPGKLQANHLGIRVHRFTTDSLCSLPVELDATRVARPVRRRLAGLNLLRICSVVNPGVLSDFIPARTRATEKHHRLRCLWLCAIEAGENPVPWGSDLEGFVQQGWRREPGARERDRPERLISFGVLGKSGTANSSTMKGPQGLASEIFRRRCRTAKIWHSG